MKDLVYRVHALPATLLSYVFDFGFLEEDIEQMYVKAMTQRQFPKITDMEVELVASAMHACLNSVREIEREGSAVSLRDVKRYLLLTDWFGARGNPGSTGNRGLQANSGSPSNRFLDHTGYAASMSLNYPCAEAYSAYVFKHLYPGLKVEYLGNETDNVSHGITPGEVGVCVNTSVGVSGSGIGSFAFRQDIPNKCHVHLHLYEVKILGDNSAGRVVPSNITTIDVRSTVLALAHVYYCRLPTEANRHDLIAKVARVASSQGQRQPRPCGVYRFCEPDLPNNNVATIPVEHGEPSSHS